MVRDRCRDLAHLAPGINLKQFGEHTVAVAVKRLRERGADAAARCVGKPTQIRFGVGRENRPGSEDATTVVMAKPFRAPPAPIALAASRTRKPQRLRMSIAFGALLAALQWMGWSQEDAPQVSASNIEGVAPDGHPRVREP